MRRTLALIPVLALVAACGAPPPPKPPATPMEWRGHTYTKCQDRIETVKAFEASGQPLVKPRNSRERKALLSYIGSIEHLSFAHFCGRGGPNGISLFGLATESIPEDVTSQGGLAKDLYQDMRQHGHSPEVIRGFIESGLFEEHMALRRLVE